MANNVAVGAIELSSIGVGYQVQDALMKAATTTLLIARTICSGKYLIVFSGNIGDVESAMETANKVGGTSVIDFLTVANVHQAVFPAMAQSVVLSPEDVGALGVIETFSAVSALVAADVAGKAANVTLFRLSLAMAMGGKGLLLMTGGLANVEAAVEAAKEALKDRGLLASAVVLPRPEKELFTDYI
ncbi:MAG: BMC domain-containing protein [Thermoguttaceae bacterium]|nr:BMC domain-containing protein [Thermoguttaceae bacterium]MBR4752689.1 BMC domain-containing protein [Thermoguttaceae bacterium]MBR5757678.1 BMC domain-containing protein [Thermoguttaceae bacterium]